ncbi:winged helix-turn-helix domain-containing protein [Halorubellus litoreus]|uniref:Winged helix-turn-helix domain-containing protein n=1 Tax=Halorubellus litoreus TaxID=755308 RepID=A0ABD5VK00_9EURY
MYRKVDWMKAADQSILQLLGSPRKLELTPSNIARNTGLSRGYTSERLSALVKHGLVEVDEESGSHPYYAITKLGEDVLEGSVDPTELSSED